MTNQEIPAKLRDDIRLRGLSNNTFEEYIQRVSGFMGYYGKPVDTLGESEIREFLLYQKETRKLKNGLGQLLQQRAAVSVLRYAQQGAQRLANTTTQAEQGFAAIIDS